MSILITTESLSEKRCEQVFSSWYSGYSFVGVCSCVRSESSAWCTPTAPRLMVIVAASPPIAMRSCCWSSPSKITAVSSSVRPVKCFVCFLVLQRGHPKRTFRFNHEGDNKDQLYNKPATINNIIPPADSVDRPWIDKLIEGGRKHDYHVL